MATIEELALIRERALRISAALFDDTPITTNQALEALAHNVAIVVTASRRRGQDVDLKKFVRVVKKISADDDPTTHH